MTGKQMKAGDSSPATRVFVLLITVAGVCLVLYSVYMVATHVNDLNRLVLDLIMFGFGFAAIWFGLTHFDIQKTETKIQQIHQKADRIKEILDRK
jgi:protein-S-isoprenylcysteine O-methyltransferase Ste14